VQIGLEQSNSRKPGPPYLQSWWVKLLNDPVCGWCASMEGSGSTALCDRPGCCRYRTLPQSGCSAFQREVGADDEYGSPLRARAKSLPYFLGPKSVQIGSRGLPSPKV
jgi:hypothetical protein